MLHLLTCPIPLRQGTKDDVVDISAGRALHAAAKNPVAPLWAENCNHQNVELSPEYLPRLRTFVRDVQSQARKP